MTKKNRKMKKLDENEIESTAAVSADTSGNPRSQENSETQTAEEEESSNIGNQTSSEDLLDDVRRALIEEEETDRNKKESKWWRRIGRKEKSTELDLSVPTVEIDLPDSSLQTEMPENPQEATEQDEYTKEIDNLIDLLAAEHPEAGAELPSAAPVAAEIPVGPEPEIDFEQLKEQAFRPRASKESQSDRDVRSIALDSGEEVFVEVESPVTDSFDERLKVFENALRPYRNYIYIALAFLGLIMAVLAAFLVVSIYRQSTPEPVKEVSNLPYPVAVSLPGGWRFDLGRGTLQAGTWEPVRAEWLEGTEVCRWVSLPWSRQLEAVLRTLNPKDPIELAMSNNDRLTYGVYSVYEMTPEEIHELDTSSPCLLIILSGSDSDKRWVLTALP